MTAVVTCLCLIMDSSTTPQYFENTPVAFEEKPSMNLLTWKRGGEKADSPFGGIVMRSVSAM